MKVDIFTHLAKHPNYLIPALILADEGNVDPLFAIYGNEKAVFEALRQARIYAGLMKTHSQADFPISTNPDGQVIKIPERLAGIILAGKTWFYTIVGSMPTAPVYGDDWLNKQTKEVKAALKTKQQALVRGPSAVEVPQLPSKQPAGPSELPSLR